jgi:hypothetical protein
MKIIFKIIILLMFIFPPAIYSQVFKGVSLTVVVGYKTADWNYTNALINTYYNNKPKGVHSTISLAIEGLSKKYFSTVFDAGIRIKTFSFEYNKLNQYGNPTGETGTTNNSINYFHLGLKEKLKYDLKTWSFYTFGGLWFDFRYRDAIDEDFQVPLGNTANQLTGAELGLGIAKGFNKWRVFADFYYESDFNKMFDYPEGSYKSSEAGFRIGIGLYNPKDK